MNAPIKNILLRATAATLVCLVGAGVLAAGAQASAARDVGGAASLARATAAMVAHRQPGAIAITRTGTDEAGAASGLAIKANKTPMNPVDRVHIGSITKTFVSTVALQLVGAGRLRLDDTLAHLLPGELAGSSYDPHHITLRQLL